MKMYEDLQAVMLLLLHLTSGPPPRGSEWAAILLRETETCRRQIIWFQNMLLFIPNYSKTDNVSPMRNLTARFALPDLSLLIADFFFVLRPLYEQIMVAREGEDKVDAKEKSVGKRNSAAALLERMEGGREGTREGGRRLS